MAKRSDLEPEIRRLWKQRPEGKRTRMDVVSFCQELQRERPDLLDFRSADIYQVMPSILRNYIVS